jgi:trimethylamine--corrinoid protein Co-methyltransferase
MLSRLTVIGAADIESIHSASLALLRNLGVNFPDAEALEILAQAGADVDLGSQTARFSERLVLEALHRCGKGYSLHGRAPGHAVHFGAGQFILASSPGQFAWVERDGAGRREPTLADTRQATLVGDALEHIDIVGGMGMALDVPASCRDVVMAGELIKGTPKVTQVWVSGGRSLRFILEMCAAVKGGSDEHRKQPMLHGFIEPVSPLRFAPTGLEILKTCARKGLPLCFAPMVQAGASGPATIAGALAVENAEILAGIVLAQLLGPGVPVCYGGIPHLFDMRAMQISFGAPEQGLMAVAMTQMGGFYGLPVYINVGLSDSKRADAQSGLERGTTLFMGALAGADTFGHMGIVGSDQGASLLQLVLDDEMAAYIKRVLHGLRVNGETLALPVIEQVGIGGSFLAELHTRDHFRNESWFPRLADRRRWEAWEADGRKSSADSAHDRLSQILAGHVPEPCDPDLARELDRIAASAATETAGAGR